MTNTETAVLLITFAALCFGFAGYFILWGSMFSKRK